MRSLIALLLVCAVVYFPGLGGGGFVSTEGHRVIPALEMLETGDWLVVRMFEQPYLRKPPGAPWAFAASFAAFGETELAARLVSALASTGMALLAFVFAARWFGRLWALGAGVAQALMPQLWESGRAAEIEAVHNLGVMASCLLLIDLMVRRPGRGPRDSAVLALLLGVSLFWMALTKGPSGVPAVLGVMAAGVLVQRSFRPLASPWPWAGIGLAGIGAGVVGWLVWARTHALEAEAITQGVGEFTWGAGRLGGVALLAPTALLSALPVTLALLFPWGPDARREAAWEDGAQPRDFLIARTLAWGCLLALAAYTLAGVYNPRYAIPATVFVAPLVGYCLRGLAGAFTDTRRRIARLMLLGHPWALPALLIVAAWIYIGIFEPGARRTSGREPGLAMADALTPVLEEERARPELWANDLVEARPETLLYARRELESRLGEPFRVRWTPGLGPDRLPDPGALIVVRTDERSAEHARLEAAGTLGRLEALHKGGVHLYTYTVYRVGRAEPDPDE